MMKMEIRAFIGAVAVAASCVIGGCGACGESPPGRTFYQREIEPILEQKCAGNTSGCHSTNLDDPYQFAAGNFDVSSFENVQKRRDVLAPFGAYPYPLLLIKGVGPNALQMSYNGAFKKIEVQHSGLAILTVNSDAFLTLQNWLQNGATEDGLKPPTPAQTGNGGCSTTIPAGFNPATYTANPNFGTFKNNVQPILTTHGCVSTNCHGAPQSDFYITCGNDDTQLAFNFSQAWSFVNNPVDDSQILKIPLAVGAGGRGHTGGDQFPATDDGDYTTIRNWASAVGLLDFAMGDPAKTFFKDNVQPILLTRGCSFQACHSPSATNDFKLRSGTQGFFSAIALQRNYELLRDNFMALELPDARRGRAVAKAIQFSDARLDPSQIGGLGTDTGRVAHRGGAVLDAPPDLTQQGQPSDPAACGAFTPGVSSPFCTVQAWLTLERTAAAAQVTLMESGNTINIVYVERPSGQTAGRLEFDTFQGTADLKVVQATFGANFGQNLSVTGTPASLLGDATCASIVNGDIQAPDVSNDGDSVAFAARPNATAPLSIWKVSIATGTCTQVTPAVADSNGIKVHNFDPAWSPDGQYIVFASTRGKGGATKSRKRFLPQSDLWRIHVADNQLEQMTFLSNSEVSPQFMREGRVTMTTEKASDGFYQLSGRRINWDLTDYHPLLAQRQSSAYSDLTDLTLTKPSIGFSSATDVREGNDGNFMLILSDVKPDGSPALPAGAGALAIFNRSIGPFESGRNDPGYMPSVRMLDAAASGHAGASSGYRAPFYMPDGQIMVSYAASLSTLAWKIVAFNPRVGVQSTDLIVPPVGRAATDAVLAYKYPARALYLNRRQLVFGGDDFGGDTGHATLHMPDAPMVFTLLTGNLRRGRPVDKFRAAQYLAVYSEGACPPAGCAGNTTSGVFQSRELLGKAQLASDGSVRVRLPAQTGLVFELQDGGGNPVVTMAEEHQLGPGEQISMGISETLFDAVCGGCHGSVTGHELDIAVTPDALTGASQSLSVESDPTSVGN